MSKVIVHIDLNAFFARAEEIKDPKLENKPVAIGHEGRSGIVSTCSYEARKYGVHSGMPMFQAKKLCPHLIIKEVDFRYYHLLSKQFIDFVKKHTEIVEQASVDECFADFTAVLKGNKNPLKYFQDFQNELFKTTKLKCSIGVAPTKFLAKMASDYKKPMGITILRRRNLEEILYPIAIEDMFGVGKKTAPKLKAVGINTIGDLKQRCDETPAQMQSLLGKFFFAIKDWVNGYGDDNIEVIREEQKSIGHSSTFMHDTDSIHEIREMLTNLSARVSERAIKDRKMGNTIQIVAKNTEFKSFNKSVTLDSPTSDAKIIAQKAIALYEQNFKGMMVRLVGVTLQNLIDPRDMHIQMSLFNYEKHEEENATRLLINEINRKLKKPLLMRASEIEKK